MKNGRDVRKEGRHPMGTNPRMELERSHHPLTVPSIPMEREVVMTMTVIMVMTVMVMVTTMYDFSDDGNDGGVLLRMVVVRMIVMRMVKIVMMMLTMVVVMVTAVIMVGVLMMVMVRR